MPNDAKPPNPSDEEIKAKLNRMEKKAAEIIDSAVEQVHSFVHPDESESNSDCVRDTAYTCGNMAGRLITGSFGAIKDTSGAKIAVQWLESLLQDVVMSINDPKGGVTFTMNTFRCEVEKNKNNEEGEDDIQIRR